ncbi:MAG: hypothetical protein P8176_02595 [Gammaproteobacteria bacterium]|jgi:hypothetical protein
MLDDLHITDFCKDVARLLLLLHQQFPRLVEIYVCDVIGHEEPDEYGLYSTRHESCLSTLLWLKAEGWLRFGNVVRREAVDQCVLTQKAFQHLHHTLPDALAELVLCSTSDMEQQHSAAIRLIHGLHHAHTEQRSELLESIVMHLLAHDANSDGQT